jgi:hypothetical protein
MFYDTDVYLVDWRESRWLVLTSIGSILPTIYSFYHSLYFLSTVSLISTFISANYWRKATISTRRDLDLVLQKVAFIIYAFHGFYYVRGYRLLVFSSGSGYLIYNYYYSNQLYYAKKREWLSHHIWFHTMILMEQMVVLESQKHYLSFERK